MSQSDLTPKKEEVHLIISGRVQGVGFRYFVIQRAHTLALRGYTRNLSDGDVEFVAQGPHAALESLLAQLRRGPSAAEVHDVRAIWREPTEHFSGFHIRY